MSDISNLPSVEESAFVKSWNAANKSRVHASEEFAKLMTEYLTIRYAMGALLYALNERREGRVSSAEEHTIALARKTIGLQK